MCWQVGQSPQKVTSASSTAKPLASDGSRHGGLADGAVDVDRDAARAADEVVMVVADADS